MDNFVDDKFVNDSDLEVFRREISKVNDLRHQFWRKHHTLKQGFLAKYPADVYSGSDKWKEIFSLIIDMENSLLSETVKRMQNRRPQGCKYDSGLYATTERTPINPEQMLTETERTVHRALRTACDPETGCTHIEAWRQEAGKQKVSPRDFKKAVLSLLKKGHAETDDEINYWSALTATSDRLCEVCHIPLSGRQKKFCSPKCKQVADSRNYRSDKERKALSNLRYYHKYYRQDE